MTRRESIDQAMRLISELDYIVTISRIQSYCNLGNGKILEFSPYTARAIFEAAYLEEVKGEAMR